MGHSAERGFAARFNAAGGRRDVNLDAPAAGTAAIGSLGGPRALALAPPEALGRAAGVIGLRPVQAPHRRGLGGRRSQQSIPAACRLASCVMAAPDP